MIAGPQISAGIREVKCLGSHLDLRPNEVQVWGADLDAFASREGATGGFLSNDERDRASRFHFERDRRRFIAGRHILRLLLSAYLDLEPGNLSFRYSAHGKPELENVRMVSRLAFNVSHSGPVALFAFVRDHKVGVDVEQLRTDIATSEIAEQFFSQSEQASLKELPKNLQHQAFFACWTRKEAFVKAKGEGLSLPLHQFDVSLTPAKPAEILGTRPDTEERHRWSLWSLDLGPGHAAALAVEGVGVDLTLCFASEAQDWPSPALKRWFSDNTTN